PPASSRSREWSSTWLPFVRPSLAAGPAVLHHQHGTERPTVHTGQDAALDPHFDGSAAPVHGIEHHVPGFAPVAEYPPDERSQTVRRKSDVEIQEVLAPRLLLAQPPQVLGPPVPYLDLQLLIHHDDPGAHAGQDGLEESVRLVQLDPALT